MGNRPPLPSPPSPSPLKVVVWGVSTRSKLCGLSLQVLSRDAYQCDETTVGTTTDTTEEEGLSSEQTPSSPEEAQENGGNIDDTAAAANIPTTSFTLPAVLQTNIDLPASAWQSKFEHFENTLLPSWKGGYARTLLLIWALLIVLCFLAAYMIPDFWGSTIFSKPWFLLGFCTTQIFLFTILIWYSRRETMRILTGTRELFRPWRRQYGINVTFYQVTNIMLTDNGGNPRRPASRRKTKQQYAGSYCFVLVCTLVREEDVEALELASLGTARNEDEDDLEMESFEEQE